jgi:FKBP-type peptidyl-prolyl cis-trans isomerase SlyD
MQTYSKETSQPIPSLGYFSFNNSVKSNTSEFYAYLCRDKIKQINKLITRKRMAETPNKYITVAYELYVMEDGEKNLMEKAPAEHPFQFISGMGTTLEAFEKELINLNKGDKFEFTLPVNDAYGEFHDEYVLDLPKNIFEINGKFDSERIYEGNIVPLMNADGARMNGTVVEVKEDIVVMDLNHPLAGKDLTFVGEVTESREATNEEIQQMANLLSGEGCGCGGCGGGCEGGCEGGCGGCN